MEKQYKTFDDLVFEGWLERRADTFSVREMLAYADLYSDAKQAVMAFENGYQISVLCGEMFYSNGKDTYEVATFKGDKLVYPANIFPDDDVLGYLTKDEVTAVMREVQDL